VRRLDAARRLLSRQQVRESLALAPQPLWRIGLAAGAQAALTTAIALPLVALSPWADLIGYASLGALVALFGRFAPRARRSRIVFYCLLCQVSAVAVISLAAWLGAPLWLQLALVALSCGAFFYISTSGGFGPPGALIFVFAASASLGHVESLAQVAARSAAVLAVAALAWLICMLTDAWRLRRGADADLPPDPIHPARDRLIRSAQITLGAAIAAFAAYAWGAPHPGWAAMGTVAVLQGRHLHIHMNRALQRMAGTIVGAGFVWLVLSQQPSIWLVMALIAGLMVLTEFVIGSNYGIAQVMVTPMALFMTFLAAPQHAGLGMVPERIFDTMLGAVVGVLIAVLLSTRHEREHLGQHHEQRSKTG